VEKGGGSLISRNGYRKAIVAAYPELSFESDWIAGNKHRGYWAKPEKCRQFFDKYAEEAGFNPSEPENWYGVTRGKIVAKGGSSLLHYYNGSHRKALVDAYPELHFAKDSWPSARKAKGNKKHTAVATRVEQESSVNVTC